MLIVQTNSIQAYYKIKYKAAVVKCCLSIHLPVEANWEVVSSHANFNHS